MRNNLDFETVADTVRALCEGANLHLSDDIVSSIRACRESSSGAARAAMEDIEKNLAVASETGLPICQDTGMAVVFVSLGRELLLDFDLYAAIDEGVRRGYREGYLRKSVVADPLRRKNTGDNTPAVVHIELSEGDRLGLTVAPKGFGSENMSAVKMLNPTASEEDVVGFVADTVKVAGSRPCPPLVLGVGIGGTFEKCALLAKKALLLRADENDSDPFYADLERRMKSAVNALGIGPMGYGGGDSCLSVRILHAPTHIAGLPVAVNVSCHVTRHMSAVL